MKAIAIIILIVCLLCGYYLVIHHVSDVVTDIQQKQSERFTFKQGG